MKFIFLLSITLLAACGGNSSHSISTDDAGGAPLSLIQGNAKTVQLARPLSQGKMPSNLRPPISE